MSVRFCISSSAAPTVPSSREPVSPFTTPSTNAGGAGPREGCPLCPPAAASPSKATLIACVLAGWGRVLTLPDLTRACATALAFELLSTYGHDGVLRWRGHCDPAEWRIRWRAAVTTTRRLYGEHFTDAAALPEELAEADTTLLPCDLPAALLPVLATEGWRASVTDPGGKPRPVGVACQRSATGSPGGCVSRGWSGPPCVVPTGSRRQGGGSSMRSPHTTRP